MLLAENLVKLLIIRRTMRDLAIDGENGENSCSHFEADPLNCAVWSFWEGWYGFGLFHAEPVLPGLPADDAGNAREKISHKRCSGCIKFPVSNSHLGRIWAECPTLRLNGWRI